MKKEKEKLGDEIDPRWRLSFCRVEGVMNSQWNEGIMELVWHEEGKQGLKPLCSCLPNLAFLFMILRLHRGEGRCPFHKYYALFRHNKHGCRVSPASVSASPLYSNCLQHSHLPVLLSLILRIVEAIISSSSTNPNKSSL